MPVNENQDFIFRDARGKRWPRLKRIAFLGALMVFCAGVFFVRSLLDRPQLRLPTSVLSVRAQLQGLQPTRPGRGALLSRAEEPTPRHSRNLTGTRQLPPHLGGETPAAPDHAGLFCQRRPGRPDLPDPACGRTDASQSRLAWLPKRAMRPAVEKLHPG